MIGVNTETLRWYWRLFLQEGAGDKRASNVGVHYALAHFTFLWSGNLKRPAAAGRNHVPLLPLREPAAQRVNNGGMMGASSRKWRTRLNLQGGERGGETWTLFLVARRCCAAPVRLWGMRRHKGTQARSQPMRRRSPAFLGRRIYEQECKVNASSTGGGMCSLILLSAWQHHGQLPAAERVQGVAGELKATAAK